MLLVLILLLFLVAVIGLMCYAFGTSEKIQRLGLVTYACGLLALLFELHVVLAK